MFEINFFTELVVFFNLHQCGVLWELIIIVCYKCIIVTNNLFVANVLFLFCTNKSSSAL